MNALETVKSHLKPGVVYRRSDLLEWSNAVDRHLEQLQNESVLKKLSGGLYYRPKTTSFGEAPPSEQALVEAFLKDDRFLILSPNIYNTLGVGTTQLYNETVVYNHKRHGVFKLGNREYQFVRKHFFPKKPSDTFLLVDLVNSVSRLAEDKERILARVVQKAQEQKAQTMKSAVTKYGSVRARKFFAKHLQEEFSQHGH